MRPHHALEGYDPAVVYMAIAYPEHAPVELKKKMVQAVHDVDNKEKNKQDAIKSAKIKAKEAARRKRDEKKAVERLKRREERAARRLGPAHEILLEVARAHDMGVRDLKGSCRQLRFATARQEFCYRAAHETDLSYTQIARVVRKDHSSVMHAIARHCAENGLDNPRGANWKRDENGRPLWSSKLEREAA